MISGSGWKTSKKMFINCMHPLKPIPDIIWIISFHRKCVCLNIKHIDYILIIIYNNTSENKKIKTFFKLFSVFLSWASSLCKSKIYLFIKFLYLKWTSKSDGKMVFYKCYKRFPSDRAELTGSPPTVNVWGERTDTKCMQTLTPFFCKVRHIAS